MLRKRYLRVRKHTEEMQSDTPSEPHRESSRAMLTAPIGGVAGGNAAHLREDDAHGEFEEV